MYCLTSLIPKEDPVGDLFPSSSAQAAISVRSSPFSPCCTSPAIKMVAHIRAKANSYNFRNRLLRWSRLLHVWLRLRQFNHWCEQWCMCWRRRHWLLDRQLAFRQARPKAQIIPAIYITSAALPVESDLVADGEAGTAHQAGQVDVDRLVARRFRVGPEVGP
jgi:hypothetical protein